MTARDQVPGNTPSRGRTAPGEPRAEPTRENRTRPPRARRAPVLLALALLATLVSSFGLEQAHAQTLPVQVVVDQLEPAAPKPSDTLRLAGRLVNTGDRPVRDLAIQLRFGTLPLDTRGEIATLTAPGNRDGVAATGLKKELRGVTIGPRGTAGWQLTVPAAKLRLSKPGIYTFGIEATSGGHRVGLAKTFLPWFPHGYPGRQQLSLTLLWPIVDRPRRDPEGVFLDDQLARDLAPNGRLHRLVSLAAGQRVTWVLDPELLETVQAMTSGYQVRDGNRTRPGVGQAAATAWLDLLRQATRGREVYLLPYGDPELAGLVHAGLIGDLKAATERAWTIGSRVLGRQLPPTPLAWPESGGLDQQTLRRARALQLDPIRVSGKYARLTHTLTYTPTSRAAVAGAGRVLVIDAQLSDTLAAAGTRSDHALLESQRFLADTAVTALERPAEARVVLAAPPKRWNPSEQVVRRLFTATDWMRPSTVAQLQASKVSEENQIRLAYSPALAKRELSRAYLANVHAQSKRVIRFAGILANPEPVMDKYSPAFLRAESAAWCTYPSAGRRYWLTVRSRLDQLERQVRITTTAPLTLSSKSGQIPITIENRLDQEVKVGVKLDVQGRRLALESAEPVRIKGNRTVTVRVPARAYANGPVLVTARLTTARGQEFGEPVELHVRATNYGILGMVIAGGVAALLFLAAGVRIWRKRRAAGTGAPADGGSASVADAASPAPSDEKVGG
ncbi:DUF6049 family protein [Carbonactinospora thermoautotrophica]|uniref:DUF6049 family protein n=1 Tax=Carbonactinospora thermoautotrophica TaxID=1469144 RepID=UPI003DA8D453